MKLLLLGESAASARYMLGVFAHAGFNVKHIESREHLERLQDEFDVVVFSDFPARHIAPGAFEDLTNKIRGGAGLLMIGGWTSFTGMGNGYAETPLAICLPVVCEPADDRRNVSSGMWLEATKREHPIWRGLDLDQPPVLCGHNQVSIADGATLLAIGRLVAFPKHTGPDSLALHPSAGESVPLLVVRDRQIDGASPYGRSVAYTSDLVPHWCGGIVDWGTQRLRLSTGSEVGDGYVTFLANLVRWAAGEL